MSAPKLGGLVFLALVLWTLLIVGVGRGFHALHCADVRDIRAGRVRVDASTATRARLEARCR